MPALEPSCNPKNTNDEHHQTFSLTLFVASSQPAYIRSEMLACLSSDQLVAPYRIFARSSSRTDLRVLRYGVVGVLFFTCCIEVAGVLIRILYLREINRFSGQIGYSFLRDELQKLWKFSLLQFY